MKATSHDLYRINKLEIMRIPNTNLTLNIKGEIKGISKFKKDGTWRVNLPIVVEGKTIVLANLDLGVLTSIVFKGYSLPWEWWGDIKLFYKDGNSYNIDPSNIAHQMWPEHFKYTFEGVDYKVIPNYTRYGISKSGVIHYPTSRMRKKLVTASDGVRGYRLFALFADIDFNLYGKKTTSVKRHRILALCYPVGPELDGYYPSNSEELEVNHINHIPGIDDLDNLEWVTTSGNQQHSVYNGGKRSDTGRGILVHDLVKDKVTRYVAKKQFLRVSGVEIKHLTNVLNRGDYKLIKGKYRVVYDDGTITPEDLKILPLEKVNYTRHGIIHILDEDNILVWKGKSFRELAKQFTINISSWGGIGQHFRQSKTPVINDKVMYLTLPNQPDYYGFIGEPN